MLETALPRAIETYNRYRGSVARATVLDTAPETFLEGDDWGVTGDHDRWVR